MVVSSGSGGAKRFPITSKDQIIDFNTISKAAQQIQIIALEYQKNVAPIYRNAAFQLNKETLGSNETVFDTRLEELADLVSKLYALAINTASNVLSVARGTYELQTRQYNEYITWKKQEEDNKKANTKNNGSNK